MGVEGASTHGLCPEYIVTDAHLRLVTAWAEPERLSDNDSVLLSHGEGTHLGPQLKTIMRILKIGNMTMWGCLLQFKPPHGKQHSTCGPVWGGG